MLLVPKLDDNAIYVDSHSKYSEEEPGQSAEVWHKTQSLRYLKNWAVGQERGLGTVAHLSVCFSVCDNDEATDTQF